MAQDVKIDFEAVSLGNIPSAWKCTSKWMVEKDRNAFSGKKVFSMKKNSKGLWGYGGGFNLCFMKKVDFKDGKISVNFRANSGSMDQGGGIIWRVQDKNNYYVARFNPLEDNFRFYKVINGHRVQLKSASIRLSNSWHKMKIVQKNNSFIGYIDGKRLLEKKDGSIVNSGGVGVWTKADARTSFDDFVVKIK